MARKCGICRKTGHDARNCPNKEKTKKAKVSLKVVPKQATGKKYPDYFYKNAPSWVANLEKAKLKTTPKEVRGKKQYCGNCGHMANKAKFGSEPFCETNDAAVRGHWWCPKWKKGTIHKVKQKKEGQGV